MYGRHVHDLRSALPRGTRYRLARRRLRPDSLDIGGSDAKVMTNVGGEDSSLHERRNHVRQEQIKVQRAVGIPWRSDR